MSNKARDDCEQGVRDRHPEYSDNEVRRAVLLLLQGREIYDMVYPNLDIEP